MEYEFDRPRCWEWEIVKNLNRWVTFWGRSQGRYKKVIRLVSLADRKNGFIKMHVEGDDVFVSSKIEETNASVV